MTNANDDLYRALLMGDPGELESALRAGASPRGDGRMGLTPMALLLRQQDEREAEGDYPDHALVSRLLQWVRDQGGSAPDLDDQPVTLFHQSLRQIFREAKEQGVTPAAVHMATLRTWMELGVDLQAASSEAPHVLAVLQQTGGAVRFMGSDARALLGQVLLEGLGHGLDPAKVVENYAADAAFPELAEPLAQAIDRCRARAREDQLKGRPAGARRSRSRS